MDELTNNIRKLIDDHREIVIAQLPEIEQAVNNIINEKCTDKGQIENMFDTLLSSLYAGVGHDLYIQLLNYYKTIDPEGAAFYWKEYEAVD